MNKYRFIVRTLVVVAMCLFFALPSYAKNLKASLGHVPGLADTPDKGFAVDFVKALDEIYKEGTISIDVYPTNRAYTNVVNGTHDFMMPMLKTETMKVENLPFRCFESLWTAIFVLYVNKNNTEINAGNIEKFKVEADRTVMQFFDKPLLPSSGVESSLKKVDIGRIDGYIFAMPETDAVLKKLQLKNIKRIEYAKFPAPIVVAKGAHGDEVEKILTPLIAQLRKNGTYDKIFAPVLNQEFIEW